MGASSGKSCSIKLAAVNDTPQWMEVNLFCAGFLPFPLYPPHIFQYPSRPSVAKQLLDLNLLEGDQMSPHFTQVDNNKDYGYNIRVLPHQLYSPPYLPSLLKFCTLIYNVGSLYREEVLLMSALLH